MKDVRVLVIEDQLDQCAIVVERLDVLSNCYKVAVDIRTTYAHAEEVLLEKEYDVVIVDNHIPGGSGAELIARLKSNGQLKGDPFRVVITGQPEDVRQKAGEEVLVLSKPQGYFELSRVVREFIEQSSKELAA